MMSRRWDRAFPDTDARASITLSAVTYQAIRRYAATLAPFFPARRTLQYYRLFTFEGKQGYLLAACRGVENFKHRRSWFLTVGPFYPPPPKKFHSVTIDMSDFVVLSSWSCYSWSARMCSEFKDTVGCFHRCLFFFFFHGTPTSKRSAPPAHRKAKKVWFYGYKSLKNRGEVKWRAFWFSPPGCLRTKGW